MNRVMRMTVLCALAMPILVGLAWADETAPAAAPPAGDELANAGQPDTTPAEATAAPQAPALASAQRAYVDPATGRLVPPPRGAERAIDARTQALLSRRSDGLLEIPSSKSGVMVDLLGRFRSATVIELDAQGQASAQCVTSLDGVAAAATADGGEVGHE